MTRRTIVLSANEAAVLATAIAETQGDLLRMGLIGPRHSAALEKLALELEAAAIGAARYSDPLPVQVAVTYPTPGQPPEPGRRKHRCSWCSDLGHSIRTCAKWATAPERKYPPAVAIAKAIAEESSS